MTVYEYIEAFKAGPHWAEMQATVEDSPWHRESNVAVHTQMVMDQYIERFASHRSEAANRVALTALLFHDIGKPAAEEEITKDDGSKYRRYAGHEPLSGNGFIQSYMTDQRLRDLLSVPEAVAVRWIIEHHLPYGLKNMEKRKTLKTATVEYLDAAGLELQTFFDCLRSDAAGRISDDHPEKLASVEAWIEEFGTVPQVNTPPSNPDKVMYMLIGASGAGKSTFTKGLGELDAVLGYDDLKVEMYVRDRLAEASALSTKDMYEAAWQYCTLGEGSKEFDKWSKQTLMDRIKSTASKEKSVVVVDTVNSTKKRRAFFISLGRQHRYTIKAVDFWMSLDELMRRQESRPEKSVPRKAVQSQLDAMSAPWLVSEVDTYEVRMQGEQNG